MTHFSSLSSRAASFFCFLMSSRFLRASARSLTALSLSRLRLSHSVLRDEHIFRRRRTKCKQVYFRLSLFSPTCSVNTTHFQIAKTQISSSQLCTVCSPSLPLSCPSPERPSPVDTWPPQPPARPPSAPGRWPRTASSASQSPCWLFPCPQWQSLVSGGVKGHVRWWTSELGVDKGCRQTMMSYDTIMDTMRGGVWFIW